MAKGTQKTPRSENILGKLAPRLLRMPLDYNLSDHHRQRELFTRHIVATPIVNTAWRIGHKLEIHGWIYGLRDGLLCDLEVSLTSPEDFDRSRHSADGHRST